MKEEHHIWADYNNKVFSPATAQQKIIQLKRLIRSCWQQHPSEFNTTSEVINEILKKLR